MNRIFFWICMLMILLSSNIFFSAEPMDESSEINLFNDTYLEMNEAKLREAAETVEEEDEAHIKGVKVLENFPIISHFWIGDFLEKIYQFMLFISMDDEDFGKKLPILEAAIFHGCSPFDDYHEIKKFNAKINYNNFLQLTNAHLIKEKYDLSKILLNIDHVLAVIRIQELIFGKNRRALKLRQKSFDEMKRNLLLLRHDIELAIILKKNLFEKEREIIKPYSGRVFCVEKKSGKRNICPVGSGTIINIGGKNYILTCRHLLEFEYSLDSEIEIYFIPDNLLNKSDFLPKERLDSTDNIVNWDKYQGCRAKSILLINSKGANHKDEADQTPLVDYVVLHAGSIKRIEELGNNNDIMLMTTDISNVMPPVKNQLVPYKDISNACVAGYPADGFANYSFIATKTSSSQIYLKSLSYTPSPMLQNYVFEGFPITHGMSGGSVFVENNVFGVLRGADWVELSTRCSVVTKEFFDRTLKHIAKLS
ncbi:MAG: hypothetical protein LBG04_00820 [Holosporaceae bacterium]|jgi:hypothetical protein|nr:hypothetical protein [Holosporaceae bacterium]